MTTGSVALAQDLRLALLGYRLVSRDGGAAHYMKEKT